MTGPASGEMVPDGGLAPGQRREATRAAACRFLSSLAAEDIPHLPAGELGDRLARCRALLAAVVETIRPDEPLARTVDEAAAALRVSPLTVYRLVNSGDLPAFRISRRLIRIDEAALRAYLAGHAVGAGGITGRDIPGRHIRPAWQ